MNFFKPVLFAISFSIVSSFAQDLTIADLPVATINSDFYVTLPDVPMADDYYIDISHIEFENKAAAEKKIANLLTANLITPKLNYEEKYVVLHIHKEYMKGDLDLERLQIYIGQLIN